MLTKFQYLLKSRKFWAAILAALTLSLLFSWMKSLPGSWFKLCVAVAAAYSTGVAIEDAGFGVGGNSS